ncbi:MAG: FHA domain-containing serine/threonine-protein kinase [Pirellulaceae bacterium]
MNDCGTEGKSDRVELLVISGHDTGRRLVVADRTELTVGRDPKCSFQLHDPAVSRLHCRVWRDKSLTSLKDADSRWGTFVNSKRITEIALRRGDRILVGETELLVTVGSEDQEETAYPFGVKTLPPRQPAVSEPDKLQAEAAARRPQRSDRICIDDDVMGLLGTRYLDFDIDSVIATARTGAVFRARTAVHNEGDATDGDDRAETLPPDRGFPPEVALKIFWPGLFTRDGELPRFVRAMRTAIPVVHENIVRVHSAGRHRGVCWTASEIVEGESVAQLIARMGVCGMLDWRRVLRIAFNVARALVAAEQHKLIHRNITPQNLLIRTQDDCVKLNDLALAKAVQQTQMQQITQVGEIVGDVFFMSPEQLAKEQHFPSREHPGKYAPLIDHRSDIYSLGATLYAMLTGRPPLEGRNLRETIEMIEVDKPKPPTIHHLSISPLLEGEVMRMLEKRPIDRHPSARTLLADLERVARYENVSLD